MCQNNYEIYNLENNEKLDLDKVSQLNSNAMLVSNPNLFKTWSFVINNHFGINVYKVTRGSDKKAWWYCDKCNEVFDCSIAHRIAGRGCPYCSCKRVGRFNNLAYCFPKIAKEWHPTKNGDLTPYDVAKYSNQNFWWLNEQREWQTPVAYRTNKKPQKIKKKIPKQSIKKVTEYMWTTNPELAKLLANPEDGYKYTHGSTKKVDWKCPECGEILKGKSISNISKRGLSCPQCSDGISYPEKIMLELLNEFKIQIIHDISFDWSNNKRYDFYLPSLNLIIETHGEQHYRGGFERVGGRGLEEEQNNDQYKYELAIANGIKPENYIEIDCRKSDFEFIKNNIMNSRLAEVFDLSEVDWIRVGEESLKSKVITTLKLWESGLTRYQIADNMQLSYGTVMRYFKKLISAVILKEKDFIKSKTIKGKIIKTSSPILEIRGDKRIVYENMWEASSTLNVETEYISRVCRGQRKTFMGSQWIFVSEAYYNKFK